MGSYRAFRGNNRLKSYRGVAKRLPGSCSLAPASLFSHGLAITFFLRLRFNESTRPLHLILGNATPSKVILLFDSLTTLFFVELTRQSGILPLEFKDLDDLSALEYLLNLFLNRCLDKIIPLQGHDCLSLFRFFLGDECHR